MSIQFLCPGCNQPIEVDSEFGGSAVGCPYCRKTVTAPRESTLPTGSGPLTAKPIVGSVGVLMQPGSYATAVRVESRNVVAIVAMFLSLITLFFFTIAAVTATKHLAELQRISTQFEQLKQRSAGMPAEAFQREASEMAEQLPEWFWVMGGGICAAGPCGLTALICGIVGVCRPRRRAWAVTALVLLFAGPAALCFLSGSFAAPPSTSSSSGVEPVDSVEPTLVEPGGEKN